MGNRSAQPPHVSPIPIHQTPPAPCRRCGGLLVTDILFDHLGPCWEEGYACQRCVNCGAIDDAVIRANRHRHLDSSPDGRRSGARTPAIPTWIPCANGRRSRPTTRLGYIGAE